ncbi:MAG: hypothetical protein WAV16_01370 [Candidatus Moraniibacteriota bacterium]
MKHNFLTLMLSFLVGGGFLFFGHIDLAVAYSVTCTPQPDKCTTSFVCWNPDLCNPSNTNYDSCHGAVDLPELCFGPPWDQHCLPAKHVDAYCDNCGPGSINCDDIGGCHTIGTCGRDVTTCVAQPDKCTCTGITGYKKWTTCDISTGKEFGSEKIEGPVCSDVPNPRVCGVCNAETEAIATGAAPAADKRCYFSTSSTTPVKSGNKWVWTCRGAATNDSCSAPYVPVPTVTLTATPPSTSGARLKLNTPDSITLNNPQNITLNWNITNLASGSCGSDSKGCECILTGPGITSSPKMFNSGDVTSHQASVTIATYGTNGINSFKASCTKKDTTNSTGSAVATTYVNCNAYTKVGVCDVQCGRGHKTDGLIRTNCTNQETITTCQMPACPVSAEIREVK